MRRWIAPLLIVVALTGCVLQRGSGYYSEHNGIVPGTQDSIHMVRGTTYAMDVYSASTNWNWDATRSYLSANVNLSDWWDNWVWHQSLTPPNNLIPALQKANLYGDCLGVHSADLSIYTDLYHEPCYYSNGSGGGGGGSW